VLLPATSTASVATAVSRAAMALRAGRVIAIPTDTVYGIAALPTIEGATTRLFELKGRRADVPLAVLCSEAGQALGLADPASLTDEVGRIASRLWPGPLTLVLPRRPQLGYELGEPEATVGVRCPDHPLVRALAAEVGPIATTSANFHGHPTPEAAADVEALFADGVALVLDGGRLAGTPSTVVDATGDHWHLLRAGDLTLTDVQAAARP
jgi:L-threonylcarbamoyladenylate synthase